MTRTNRELTLAALGGPVVLKKKIKLDFFFKYYWASRAGQCVGLVGAWGGDTPASQQGLPLLTRARGQVVSK